MSPADYTTVNQARESDDAPPRSPTGIYVLSPTERRDLYQAWTSYVATQQRPWWRALSSARDFVFQEVFCCALEGLIDHFRAARHLSIDPMLPSMLVHRLWLVWLEAKPQDLCRVMQASSGRALDAHSAAPDITSPMANEALAAAWVGAHRAAGVPTGVTSLPPLFRIDCRFSHPDGFLFMFRREDLLAFQLDDAGDPVNLGQVQSWLEPRTLFALGLVSQTEATACQAQRDLRSNLLRWFFENLLQDSAHSMALSALNSASKSHPGMGKAA